MRIKAFDAVIALAAAGAIAFASFSAYAPGKGLPEVVIKGKDGEWIYPLSADMMIAVAGPLGDTKVEIADKAVRIEESPCPNQTCVASGKISRAGQWIACLPNRVLVHIEGGPGDVRIDAAAY